MYVIEDKVFLHMVKSAGISVHIGAIESNKLIHVNQRHASINNLPEKYSKLPRYAVIRKPEDWYRSFYRFFFNVAGYMSFMINDPKEDGYIYPIGLNEFVRRSINLKETLIKFPNKARVFNNILRTQSNMHFITGYFTEAIDKDNPDSLNQFDMSLYEWFYYGCGQETAINIPMNRLDIVEELFDIKIGHANKTSDSKPKEEYEPDVLELIRTTHSKFYDLYNDFDESTLS